MAQDRSSKQQFYEFCHQKHMGPEAQPPANARDVNGDTSPLSEVIQVKDKTAEWFQNKVLVGFSHLSQQLMSLGPKNKASQPL